MTRGCIGALLCAAVLVASRAAAAPPLICAAAAPPLICAATADSIRYSAQITSVNRVGLTVTNYGFFGNNFNSRSPSFEFPLGAGFEHMSRAGLWVGAIALSDTGLFTGVSTGIVDDNQGSNALSGTEFTPAGNAILERSRITNSPHYSPKAISDQDLIGAYSDEPARGPQGFLSEPHHPLDIVVEQKVLGFSLPAAQDFEVVRFNVINHGPPLKDAYVGLFIQFAPGDKGHSAGWPPSAWYYKVYAEYDTTRRMYRAHYCESVPYPSSCVLDRVPPWAALKLLLVHPDTVAAKTVSFNWWGHTLGDSTLDEDTERYARMSNGLKMDPRDCHAGAQQCSPIAMLSVGPFAQIDPGDTVTVDYALIGGDDDAALFRNADFAQFAADINYRLPSPPPSPRLHVAAGANRVDFYWDDSPETTPDETSPAPGHLDFEGYRLYLGLDRQHPQKVAQFDRAVAPGDTVGFNTGFAAVRRDTVIDGTTYRYHYAVTGLKDGFNYFGAVTSYDLGDDRVASLESGLGQNKFQVVPLPAPGEGEGVVVFPNPYRVEAQWDRGAQVRDHYLWFARLPSHCMLRIYTLAGDRVFETRFDGANYHGEGARGLFDPLTDLDTGPPSLSGSSYAWNMITSEGQALATGLYVFSVEDLESGRVRRGKFLVVKSDREGQ